MPSPFPGMDPFLEAQGHWESCHAAMVTHSAEDLNESLPEGYVAKIETRVAFVSLEIPGNQRVPDVLVGRELDSRTTSFPSSPHDAGVATIEPITIPFALSEVELRDRWIEILSLPEMEVVTVIEILSPSNKAGSGRVEYLSKRAALVNRPVNFVEIDLLLGGRRMPMAGPLPPGDYYAIVGRSSGTPNAQVFAWTIRHVLPVIPIPLREPESDASLNLQGAFDLTYDRGRYSRIVRYGKLLPESLPLARTDRDWSESLGR
jgi:Protein of unknown function (DUF4058)